MSFSTQANDSHSSTYSQVQRTERTQWRLGTRNISQTWARGPACRILTQKSSTSHIATVGLTVPAYNNQFLFAVCIVSLNIVRLV